MNVRLLLEKQPIFKGLDPDCLEALARISEVKTWQEGDLIFSRGEAAEAIYLILAGEVLLEWASAGKGELTVQRLKPGDILGYSWLLAANSWQLDARATGKVEAVLMNAASVRAKCEEDHDFGYEFMKRYSLELIKRLRESRSQMLECYKTMSA